MSSADDDLVERLVAQRTALDQRISGAGRSPDDVTVVAVTKGFGPGAATAAFAAGFDHIGESYAQEWVTKAPDVRRPDDRPTAVHFVGRLQTNKVRSLVGLVDVWESVDRPSLVAELARRAPGAEVLVQVNVSDEAQKGGCPPDDVAALVTAAREGGLEVAGLMAVAAQFGEVVGDVVVTEATVADQFALVARLADELGLAERSMGMTADLDLALAAGSTIIRLGTALFGPRPPRVVR